MTVIDLEFDTNILTVKAGHNRPQSFEIMILLI